MPRSSRNYKAKITIQLTPHMLADLDNIAAKSGQPRAEIVRQAIRNALDDTDLTLGTKRRFDNRFQARFDEMEKHMEQTLTRFLESMRDVYVQQVVKESMAEIKSHVGSMRAQDAQQMDFYLALVALMCGNLLWHATPKRDRPENLLHLIDRAIEMTRGNMGWHIRKQIRDGR
jgi:metal-responsive CopG/Arc/MetJ family transcriptional regulator